MILSPNSGYFLHSQMLKERLKWSGNQHNNFEHWNISLHFWCTKILSVLLICCSDALKFLKLLYCCQPLLEHKMLNVYSWFLVMVFEHLRIQNGAHVGTKIKIFAFWLLRFMRYLVSSLRWHKLHQNGPILKFLVSNIM